MPRWLERWLASLQEFSWWEILLYSFVAAFLIQWLVTRLARVLTRRTTTNLDDRAVAALRWPLFLTVLLVGIALALRQHPPPSGGALAVSVLWSLGIVFWTRALMKIGDAFLETLARRVDDFRWIEPRSLPLYEIGSKLLLLGGATYAIMLAWDIDVTAWLASAGVLGIAIGFAAKDTLANLFAGVFILADAPYKLGDFIVLESGERGRVTDIGIRSTRLLTRDDIEITLPNGIMANSKIVNETSGPHAKRRLRIDIGVAYGTDLDQAKSVLLEAARASPLLAAQPGPSVRFRSFGDSAVNFQVRGFIEEPVLHGRAVDDVGLRLYKALAAAEIEIPYPQRVVHMPAGSR
jgi:MscS family membrane protein